MNKNQRIQELRERKSGWLERSLDVEFGTPAMTEKQWVTLEFMLKELITEVRLLRKVRRR